MADAERASGRALWACSSPLLHVQGTSGGGWAMVNSEIRRAECGAGELMVGPAIHTPGRASIATTREVEVGRACNHRAGCSGGSQVSHSNSHSRVQGIGSDKFAESIESDKFAPWGWGLLG